MKVAVTGGFGSGKSTVLRLIREKGFPVVDLDVITRALLRRSEVRERLIREFGKGVKQGRGVSRKKLARIVFDNEKARKKLEALLHPLIFEKMVKQLQRFEKRYGAVFVEVPLLYEVGWESFFDRVVVVYAPKDLRYSRLKEKGFTESEISARLKAQLPLEQKKERADCVVENMGDIAELTRAVDRLLADCLRLH